MADITKNPPKQETTPGQSIDARKTGDKKVVEELQEFNTQSKRIAADAKSGFRAIVEGIKQGNAELNPEKTQISGFKELTDAQQNVVNIFGDMKDSTERSQAGMAKDMSIEKGTKLENAKEQYGLWERMLLRLVGIDEDLDKLIQNTTPRPEEKGWLGKIFTGLILGAVTGFVAGMVFGFAEVLLLYAKLLVKGVRFVGGKFINSKFMAPIVEPIRRFFTNIGDGIRRVVTKIGNLIKPIVNTFKNIKTQFLHGLFGKGGGVAGLKGVKGMGTTKNVFTQIGAFFSRIQAWTKGIGGPVRQFNTKTKTLGKELKMFGSSTRGMVKALGGGFKTMKSFFGFIRVIFNPIWAGFRSAFVVFKNFGRVVGRLFMPLTIIMGLVDGVKGFIDGFKNTEGGMFKKVIGGLIGAHKGIINGLIMMPLDMLKGAVAWILSKFGFDGMAEGLKSFSFQEMFSSFIDMFTNTLWAVIDWFKLLFSNPGQALKDLVSGYANMMMNFYKAIVRMILPDPKGGKWYNPLSLIQRVIPDSVYTWAGLNPDTGERIEDSPEADALKPTPETQSTLSRWGDSIKGKFRPDPVTEMQPFGPPVPGSQTANVVVPINNSSSSADQTIINMVGDTSNGLTLGRLRRE